MTQAAPRRFGEYRADAADAHRSTFESPRQVVTFRTGEKGDALHQRKSSPATPAPGGFHLGRVEPAVRLPVQAVVRVWMSCVKDAVENDPLNGNHGRHAIIMSVVVA